MPLVLAAAVPELFPAIALLLLVWAALIILRKPLVDLLSRIPAIGGQVASAVGNGIQDIINWALSWAHQALDPLVQLVWTPIQSAVTEGYSTIAAIEQVASLAAAIPSALAQVVSWAAARLDALRVDAAHLAARVTSLAADAAATASAAARTLVASLERSLSQAIAAAEATLRSAIAAAAATAATATAELRAWAASQLLGASRALSAAVATLDHLTGVELPDIRGQLAHLADALGLLTAAGLIGRVLTLERTVTQTVDECVRPTCNVLGPQLAGLNLLMDAATLGLVGAFVAEAIANPDATARATVEVVTGAEGIVSGLASDLAGIRL